MGPYSVPGRGGEPGQDPASKKAPCKTQKAPCKTKTQGDLSLQTEGLS